jgi:hypothetical protein
MSDGTVVETVPQQQTREPEQMSVGSSEDLSSRVNHPEKAGEPLNSSSFTESQWPCLTGW